MTTIARLAHTHRARRTPLFHPRTRGAHTVSSRTQSHHSNSSRPGPSRVPAPHSPRRAMPRPPAALDAASVALARALNAELNVGPRRRSTTRAPDASTGSTDEETAKKVSREYRHSWPVTKVRVRSGGYPADDDEGAGVETREKTEERSGRRVDAREGGEKTSRARDDADGDDGARAARREAARLRKNAMSRAYKARKRAMMMAESGVVVVKAVREDAVEETATVVKKRRVADEAEVSVSTGNERARGKKASTTTKSRSRSKGTPTKKMAEAAEAAAATARACPRGRESGAAGGAVKTAWHVSE